MLVPTLMDEEWWKCSFAAVQNRFEKIQCYSESLKTSWSAGKIMSTTAESTPLDWVISNARLRIVRSLPKPKPLPSKFTSGHQLEPGPKHPITAFSILIKYPFYTTDFLRSAFLSGPCKVYLKRPS